MVPFRVRHLTFGTLLSKETNKMIVERIRASSSDAMLSPRVSQSCPLQELKTTCCPVRSCRTRSSLAISDWASICNCTCILSLSRSQRSNVSWNPRDISARGLRDGWTLRPRQKALYSRLLLHGLHGLGCSRWEPCSESACATVYPWMVLATSYCKMRQCGFHTMILQRKQMHFMGFTCTRRVQLFEEL